MSVSTPLYRPLMYRTRVGGMRASLPVFAVALSWLLLTALLPLAVKVEPRGASPSVVEFDPARQRERLGAFSEALLWPFGLAPANAQTINPSANDSPSRPANCG